MGTTALALELADSLSAVGYTADTIDEVPDSEWATAMWCAAGKGIAPKPVGPYLKRLVRVVLEERAKHPDPFAGLGV
jgi:hypothetical protein